METCVTLLIYFIKMYYKQGQYIYKLFIYRNVPHITNLLYKYVLQTGNIYIFIFIYISYLFTETCVTLLIYFIKMCYKQGPLTLPCELNFEIVPVIIKILLLRGRYRRTLR